MTRKEAISAGSAICKAAKRTSEENAGAHNDQLRHAARGACIYALDNLWYDVVPLKVRDTFQHRKEEFYAACGWPD